LNTVPGQKGTAAEGLPSVLAAFYAKFFSRSHDAVIRVYDETNNVIETHEHAGDFKEW